MKTTAKFWDRLAEKYSKKPVANQEVYETKLKRTQEYLKPTMKVLEFGCGTGSTALLHSPFVEHIHAIDISPKMIEIANDKATLQACNNVSFEVDTLESLNCDEQSFDVILGLSILHLLPNWQQSIATIHQLLKPNGLFVSSTVCLKHLWILRILAPIGQFLGLIPTLSYLSSDELKNNLTEQGFKIEHFWKRGKNTRIFIIARKL